MARRVLQFLSDLDADLRAAGLSLAPPPRGGAGAAENCDAPAAARWIRSVGPRRRSRARRTRRLLVVVKTNRLLALVRAAQSYAMRLTGQDAYASID